MKFEDLTHVDISYISRKYPAKWTMPDMNRFSKEISDKYGLPFDDAVAAFLVASECRAEYKQIKHVYTRRMSQLIKRR